MQVIVDDLLINYHRQGSGKRILLLHGWGNTLNDLDELTKDLAKDFEVTAIDLPGFGASQAPNGVWGLKEYSSFLASYIKKVGLDDIYCVIGHSNGGALAIKALASGDVSADRLVLLASAGIRNTKKGRLGAIKLATKTAKVITLPLPTSTKKRLRQKLYKTVGSDLLLVENLSESFKKIVAEDLQPEAAKLSLPTLLIYGEEDDMTPISYGQLFHNEIEDSTLEIVAGAGHELQKTKPKLVVKLIQDFLC